MIQVIKYRKVFFIISGILAVSCILSLIFWRLNLGIDFKGGSVLELNFAAPADPQKVYAVLEEVGLEGSTIQTGLVGNLIIKTKVIDSQQQRKELLDSFKENFGEFEEIRFESIGPIIGNELKQKAIYQVLLVNLGILLYIAYAFRQVGAGKSDKKINPWRLGWAAIIALFHDLIIVLGLFSVLGKFRGVEIDSLFVTAILTVLGFSVHDTIVVFDRIRENMRRDLGMSFEETLNFSINQTLIRSVNTSMTVILVLLALALFGGGSTFYFVIALLVGIVTGTYSSIFIASPLLLIWSEKKG